MFSMNSSEDPMQMKQTEKRPMRNLLVTGGCGFIGSNFINYFVRESTNVQVWNLDKMNYCANLKSVNVGDVPTYHFICGDITDVALVRSIFEEHNIDTVVHFAAQTHVENSFRESLLFTTTNVLGTHILLECAREYGKIEKFLYISTDEVYGERFSPSLEEDLLCPTNPYAASKAAAECIVRSYHRTYNFPVMIVRMNNTYGPYQYPEKLIPRFVMLALLGRPLTIQGTGENKRSFIHVSDVVRAIGMLLHRGSIGEIYNIGTRDEYSVMDIARRVVTAVKGEIESQNDLQKHIVTVDDRISNDKCYVIDFGKLEAIGWRQEVSFEEGFSETIKWYTIAFEKKFWPSIQDEIDGMGGILKNERHLH